jgi:putative SOS response-associated peptidase YedK
MCYNISLIKDADQLELRFTARFVDKSHYQPMYHVSAFSFPALPVITNNAPNLIQFFQWGLIPSWVKDKREADQIKLKTLNARSDTVTIKPAYRDSMRNKRCLVLTDGFYEWHEKNNKKYPFHIRLKSREAFAMAGIWDTWEDKEDGKPLNTFSIVTTKANPLLARIHNAKERMPIILRQEDEKKWMSNDFDMADFGSILVPYDEGEMEAFPVSRLLSSKSRNTNVPEVMAPFQYEDLTEIKLL